MYAVWIKKGNQTEMIQFGYNSNEIETTYHGLVRAFCFTKNTVCVYFAEFSEDYLRDFPIFLVEKDILYKTQIINGKINRGW